MIRTRRSLRLALLAAAVSAVTIPAAAAPQAGASASAQAQPESAPPSPTIAPPRDVPYAGVIKLAVDATDLDHRTFRVRETIPAQAGPMTLLYPQWLPGHHSPSGPIPALTDLKVTAGGQPLAWRRDPVEVYAFHVDVPAGAAAVEVSFTNVTPVDTREGRVVMTPEMLDLAWNEVVLYPSGYYARQISVQPSLTLPAGWTFGSALDGPQTSGATTVFAPTPLNTLVDSPVYAGKYGKRIDLDPGGVAPVHMDIFADKPDLLEIKPEQLQAHRNLVQQAYKTFGSRHYDHYDFLVSLSDRMSGNGLEHHRSSEDGTVPTYFTEWDKNAGGRDLFSHEYTHSWDGKFRRPADLWTPNFNVPMRDSLLWVYEGQTQYWGYVLAARAGLWNHQEALDSLANVAAGYQYQPGRSWRSVEDTTNDPIMNQRRPLSWRGWQRAEDYYSEGQLMWLDADTLIREKSGGKKSLDDFAKAFFGVHNGSYVTDTYTFDDVVAALNAVKPYDWAAFLHKRIYEPGQPPPLDGFTRGGYRLVFTDKPNEITKQSETRRHAVALDYSIGASLGKDGALTDVRWGGPAFQAGLTGGWTVVAVNGEAYDGDKLKDAIKAAKGTTAPIELIVKNGDVFKTVKIDYHDGLRYPHLEKAGAGPASLDAILTARK